MSAVVTPIDREGEWEKLKRRAKSAGRRGKVSKKRTTVKALLREAFPESSDPLENLKNVSRRERLKADLGRAFDDGVRESIPVDPDEAALEREAKVAAEVERLAIRDEAAEIRAQQRADVDTDAPTYVDVAALGDDVEAPKPTAGSMRDDGVFMLYPGEINVFGGEPGAFKTGSAALAAVETLKRGGRVLWFDLDHNGAQATVARLLAAGAPLDVLRDPTRFRLVVGESPAQVLAALADAADWLEHDDLIVMDSAGELVAMFGGNSNDADDWTRINRQTLTPLADTGAAVLLLDHFPKTANGTGYSTGTSAKKRTIGGAFYALSPFKDEPPRPNDVGKVAFTLLKDRHGGTGYVIGDVVAVLEVDSRDPNNGPWSWRLMPGRPKDERDAAHADADVAYVLSLNPFPSSVDTLLAALKASQGKGWRRQKAVDVLAEARRRRNQLTTLDPNERTEEQ